MTLKNTQPTKSERSQQPSQQEAGLTHVEKPVTNHLSRSWALLESGWVLELTAILISFLSFAALVAVLLVYDNQPQQSWSSSHLTLNGLVAILSTITRASLLVPVASAVSQSKWSWFLPARSAVKGRPLRDLNYFDDASRGSWGSLRLLWNLRGRQFVCIGAILTLLALAFDTFSQQVLSVRFNEVLDASSYPPTFVRNERYGREHDTKGPTGAHKADVDLPMKAAIMNGILAANIADLPVTCATGNCTWPIIPTLGVCGGCTNVTSNITSDCPEPWSTFSTDCTWSLPSGTSSISHPLKHDYPRKSFLVANGMRGDVYGGRSCEVSDGSGDWTKTTQCSNVNALYKTSTVPYNIANFEAIMIPWYQDIPVPDTSGPTAVECALWMCVQAHNVSVSQGRVSQSIVNTWDTWRENIDAMLQGAIEFTGIPEEFNCASNSTFLVSEEALLVTQDAFNLSGSIYANYDLEPSYSNDIVQSMGVGAIDWDAWIQKVARSISNNVRTNSRQANTDFAFMPDDEMEILPPNPHYAGSAFITRPYVHVRWAWLSYPAGMLVASFAYLLLTMYESRQNGAHTWKENPLVLLTLALDPSITELAKGCSTRLNDLDERIGSEKVVLDYDWGVWRLRRQASVPASPGAKEP